MRVTSGLLKIFFKEDFPPVRMDFLSTYCNFTHSDPDFVNELEHMSQELFGIERHISTKLHLSKAYLLKNEVIKSAENYLELFKQICNSSEEKLEDLNPLSKETIVYFLPPESHYPNTFLLGLCSKLAHMKFSLESLKKIQIDSMRKFLKSPESINDDEVAVGLLTYTCGIIPSKNPYSEHDYFDLINAKKLVHLITPSWEIAVKILTSNGNKEEKW